jgi:hypothetical protein
MRQGSVQPVVLSNPVERAGRLHRGPIRRCREVTLQQHVHPFAGTATFPVGGPGEEPAW